MVAVILLLLLTLRSQHIDAHEPVTVHTQYGDILGYQTDSARVFYRIPFSKPPIGRLR